MSLPIPKKNQELAKNEENNIKNLISDNNGNIMKRIKITVI